MITQVRLISFHHIFHIWVQSTREILNEWYHQEMLHKTEINKILPVDQNIILLNYYKLSIFIIYKQSVFNCITYNTIF